jgi:phage antirepressor YoqD-like protein
VLFAVGSTNQTLQTEVQTQQNELQKQQEEINKANQISQQVGPALVRDMASVSVKNEKMKALLAHHGYTVTVATPTPGAGAPKNTPAPAPSSEAPGRLNP